MKKILITSAALTLVISIMPSALGGAKAAPITNPYCNMAKYQRNPVAWNAHYHCLDQTTAAPVVNRQPARHAAKPYCDMAKSQRNPVSWNEHYRCLSER